MRKYITKSLILIKFSTLPFFFIGCGDAKQTVKTRKDAAILGEGTSIATDNKTLSLSSMEKLNQQMSEIIKTHLEAINTKEATVLSKETHYCEIDGHKEVENSSDVSEHISQISFCDCQDDQAFQNGILEVAYNQADEDGKYPKELTLTAHDHYYYNEIELGDHTTITIEDIQYTNGEISSLIARTSGEVTVEENQTITLQNFTHRLDF